VKLIMDGLAAGLTRPTASTVPVLLFTSVLTTIAGQELDTGFHEFQEWGSIQSTVQKWKDWYDNTELDVVADLQSGRRSTDCSTIWANRQAI
jgi:hypothetical protein